jgi:hypothetical protein
MSSINITELCQAAMARITSHINRAAGQHRRAIRNQFEQGRRDLTKNTGVAVPTAQRPGAMDPRADRSACPPAARAAAGRTVLMRESAADVALSIVLGIGFALLSLHGLNALFH